MDSHTHTGYSVSTVVHEPEIPHQFVPLEEERECLACFCNSATLICRACELPICASDQCSTVGNEEICEASARPLFESEKLSIGEGCDFLTRLLVDEEPQAFRHIGSVPTLTLRYLVPLLSLRLMNDKVTGISSRGCMLCSSLITSKPLSLEYLSFEGSSFSRIHLSLNQLAKFINLCTLESLRTLSLKSMFDHRPHSLFSTLSRRIHTGLTSITIEDFASESLLSFLKACPNLRSLSLAKVQVSSELFTVLANLKEFRALSFEGLIIEGSEGPGALVGLTSLLSTIPMTYLSLRELMVKEGLVFNCEGSAVNCNNKDEMLHLAQALKSCKTLKSLELVQCGFTAQSFKPFAEALSNHYSLENLNISNNPGIANNYNLSEILKSHILKSLNASGCGSIEEDIEGLLYNRSLRALNLSNCNLIAFSVEKWLGLIKLILVNVSISEAPLFFAKLAALISDDMSNLSYLDIQRNLNFNRDDFQPVVNAMIHSSSFRHVSFSSYSSVSSVLDRITIDYLEPRSSILGWTVFTHSTHPLAFRQLVEAMMILAFVRCDTHLCMLPPELLFDILNLASLEHVEETECFTQTMLQKIAW